MALRPVISTHWSAISSVFYAALLTFSLSKPLAATVAGQRSQPRPEQAATAVP
jgi:hypothetical protein